MVVTVVIAGLRHDEAIDGTRDQGREVGQLDEVVGLAAQLVCRHRRRRLDGADDRDAQTAVLMGDLKLVDVEDDDVAEITVNGPLLKRYKQNLAAYRAALHDFCSRRGVTCLFTSNQVPFDRLVLTYLRQRGLVR